MWRRLLLDGSCLEGSCMEVLLWGWLAEESDHGRVHGRLLLRGRCSLVRLALQPGILPPPVLPPVFCYQLEQVQVEVVQEVLFQLHAVHEDDMAHVFPLLLVVVGIDPQDGVDLLLVWNGLLQDTQDVVEEGIFTGMGGALTTP